MDIPEVLIFEAGRHYLEAAHALNLLVKYDGYRVANRWTVGIPGIGRADAETPEDAAKKFGKVLKVNAIDDCLASCLGEKSYVAVRAEVALRMASCLREIADRHPEESYDLLGVAMVLESEQ